MEEEENQKLRTASKTLVSHGLLNDFNSRSKKKLYYAEWSADATTGCIPKRYRRAAKVGQSQGRTSFLGA